MNKDYTSKNIQVLKGLQAVRIRPSMYIGDTDKKGLHHLIWEITDNSFDEAIAGFCKNIEITLHADGETLSVEDDGRGIPVDTHPTEGKSSLEVVMTTLHAGGKMTSEESGYMVSGGLHGVGASCVNALSDTMTVDVYRDGYLWQQTYSKGVPTSEVIQVKKLLRADKQNGTCVTWHADKEIFKRGVKIDEKEIVRKMREAAFLNKGLSITFINKVTNTKQNFKFDGGIKDYVLYLSENKNGIYPAAPIYAAKKENKIDVEYSILWNDSDDEVLQSYANNINTIDGGTHLSGFKTSLTRTINKLGREKQFLKEKDDNLDGRDIQEGICCVVSIKLSQPEFVGQTKAKLGTVEADGAVSTVVASTLLDYFEKNEKDLAKIIQRAQISQRARKAAKDASAAFKKKSFLGQSGRIPEKLRDCRSDDLSQTELWIVEGASAAGSSCSGRDSEYQAVLALKGKIINAEKCAVTDLLKNEEVSNIMIAIGTGIKDDFDINRLRYGKIIINCDADFDGAHIATLLLAFFYKYMRSLINNGNVYIANAPLYMVESKPPVYCWNKEELDKTLNGKKIDVKRFKGLGEMNSDQLYETTMKKGSRKITQVSIADAAEADRMMDVLMGNNIAERKKHIQKNLKV